jgi:ribosomal protein L25 (general stress protein Ctc)
MLFIITVFRGDERTDKKRKKPSTDHLRARPIQLEFGKETTKVVPIPIAAAAYNNKINHVD